MGKMMVPDSHDCPLPEMKFSVVKEVYYRKNFLGFKKPYEVTKKKYDVPRAKFECDCGRVWHWTAGQWIPAAWPIKWIEVDY